MHNISASTSADEEIKGDEMNSQMNTPDDKVMNPPQENRMNNTKPEKPYVYGFGGWLILVAIGLMLTFGQSVLYLFQTMLPIFNSEKWEILTSPSSELYHSLWAPALIFDLSICLVNIICILCIAFLCYKLSRKFKTLMIVFISLKVLFAAVSFILMYILSDYYSNPEIINSGASLKTLFQSIVYASIWIPYFIVSKRVKNTYIV